jgi:HEAT repeat protein
METADMASSKDPKHLSLLIKRLQDKDPDIRYWAATGCTILGKEASGAKKDLEGLLTDKEPSVQIAAAEALYMLGEKKNSINVLINALKGSNVMARVQALNVLETTDKKDALLARADLQAIIAHNAAGYDVRAAQRLLSELLMNKQVRVKS